MAPGLYWSLTAVLVLVLLFILGWAYQTANRLDRLHVRCDLSWQAVDAALGRRAVVARAIAADIGDPSLAGLADTAERSPRPA